MKPIGGFFELEVQAGQSQYHEGAIALSNGRACLNFILQQTHPNKIWLPFYTCDALLDPIQLHQIPYEFYGVNKDLEPDQDFHLRDGEYLIYINYFGLKQATLQQLIQQYGQHLIVDNTQAFFERGYSDIWSFNSARKFFGVPDGAYLYTPGMLHFDGQRNLEFGYTHLIDRLLGKQQQAYQAFLQNEQASTSAIQGISLLTERLLSNLNYEDIATRRRENFIYYQQVFQSINALATPLESNTVPYFYPLLLETEINRTHLFAESIFIPTFWQDTLNRSFSGFAWEKKLTRQLLPLPIDHRYQSTDLDRVIGVIQRLAVT
jgi:hypothetical protein